MDNMDRDTLMRMAAFEHVRRLSEVHDHLTNSELSPGFMFESARIPLVNPQRGIFKPRQMRYLLSIKTVFPRPGAKVWYDDQREVHRQIFESEEAVDYAFMGQDPDAADTRPTMRFVSMKGMLADRRSVLPGESPPSRPVEAKSPASPGYARENTGEFRLDCRRFRMSAIVIQTERESRPCAGM